MAVTRVWMKARLKRLALALGEEFVTEERLEIYADHLCAEMELEELEEIAVRAEKKMVHFPQIVDLLWFLRHIRWMEEPQDEKERELRRFIDELSREEPPSMRERRP